MKKFLYILTTALAVMMVGCKDDVKLNPYDYKGTGTPGLPVVQSVKSIAGGAIITYDVPKDPDLLYVKALYTNTQGKVCESRSSFYVDSIRIVGLGDTQERTVELYAVNRSEKISAPVYQTIVPGRPAVAKILESLKQKTDWGGFLLDYNNEDKEEVGIFVTYTNQETAETVTHDVFFTSRPGGTIAVRGLQSLDTDFGIYVTDKWGNSSDTLRFNLTPWKESELNKKLFKLVPRVLDDVEWDKYAGSPQCLWDNIMPGNWNFAHTNYPLAFPHAITIDLGVMVKLSRMKMWQYLGSESDYYAHGFPRHFRIYGCPTDKDPFKAESWTLLLDKVIQKPSGGEFGSPNTPDDIEEAQRGHEFGFEMDVPEIRYFRLQSLASWSGMEVSRIAEISLWGDVSDL